MSYTGGGSGGGGLEWGGISGEDVKMMKMEEMEEWG